MRNSKKILITGSKGLIGRALSKQLIALGMDIVELDLCGLGDCFGDVCSKESVRDKIQGVSGVVHLAAVSRVVWGERDPEKCHNTNVNGTRNIIEASIESPTRPWVLFSSSREVYGEHGKAVLDEGAACNPVSIYGVTKVKAEEIVLLARRHGIKTGVVRFSNVYGCPQDHHDRVIPRFVRAALLGAELFVEGRENSYDFTHLSDVTAGLIRYIGELSRGQCFPPIHFVTEVTTSLYELAKLTISELQSPSAIVEMPSRSYGSRTFRGKNVNALNLLGWKANVDLASGIRLLANELRDKGVGAPISPQV